MSTPNGHHSAAAFIPVRHDAERDDGDVDDDENDPAQSFGVMMETRKRDHHDRVFVPSKIRPIEIMRDEEEEEEDVDEEDYYLGVGQNRARGPYRTCRTYIPHRCIILALGIFLGMVTLGPNKSMYQSGTMPGIISAEVGVVASVLFGLGGCLGFALGSYEALLPGLLFQIVAFAVPFVVRF